MKNKNPLYVVKGKDVQEAKSIIDMVVKRFNLEPMINILKNLFLLLLEQVENYATFQVVKAFIDQIIHKIHQVLKKMGALSV